MKWNENGHECELRLVLNGGEWEGPQGREVLPRDLIAALRANPDVRSEVFRELLPVILAEHDASESRALAAEKERDTWCDTAHALKRERDVAQEHARRAQADATGWGLRLGDAEEKARSAERTAKHYFDQYEALREERDATLSKLAGVEQELTRELSYNLQLLRDIDALRKVVAWMRQLRDEDFLQCERPNRDECDECTCVPCSARSALARLDARDATAQTGQDVEAERSEWKALADEFARDAVSLEPAREIVAEYRRAKAKLCRRAEEAIRDRDAALAKLAEAEKFLGRCESQRLVPSSQCSVEEIALARDGGRMHVTSDGLGYVARTTARDPKIRPVWGAPPLPPHPPPITQAEEMRRRERISPTPRIEEDDTALELRAKLAEVERERDAEREERAKVERWYQDSVDERKALREVVEAAREAYEAMYRVDFTSDPERWDELGRARMRLSDTLSRLDARDATAQDKTPGESWGVWCERPGTAGFWREFSPGVPLETTKLDARRRARTLNENQLERRDSLGWIYEARQHKTPGGAGEPAQANSVPGMSVKAEEQSRGGETTSGDNRPSAPTGGLDSSVGVAATAEDGREVPAQNRQRAEPPSDPATGTTRREPPESACSGASTGAVALTRCVFCKGSGIQAGPGEYTAEPCYGCNGTGLKPPPRPALTPEQRAEVVLRSELLDALRLAATRQAFSTGVLPPHAKMLADVAAHLLKGGE